MSEGQSEMTGSFFSILHYPTYIRYVKNALITYQHDK